MISAENNVDFSLVSSWPGSNVCSITIKSKRHVMLMNTNRFQKYLFWGKLFKKAQTWHLAVCIRIPNAKKGRPLGRCDSYHLWMASCIFQTIVKGTEAFLPFASGPLCCSVWAYLDHKCISFDTTHLAKYVTGSMSPGFQMGVFPSPIWERPETKPGTFYTQAHVLPLSHSLSPSNFLVSESSIIVLILQMKSFVFFT